MIMCSNWVQQAYLYKPVVKKINNMCVCVCQNYKNLTMTNSVISQVLEKHDGGKTLTQSAGNLSRSKPTVWFFSLRLKWLQAGWQNFINKHRLVVFPVLF